jgi:hypothetical protein
MSHRRARVRHSILGWLGFNTGRHTARSIRRNVTEFDLIEPNAGNIQSMPRDTGQYHIIVTGQETLFQGSQHL